MKGGYPERLLHYRLVADTYGRERGQRHPAAPGGRLILPLGVAVLNLPHQAGVLKSSRLCRSLEFHVGAMPEQITRQGNALPGSPYLQYRCNVVPHSFFHRGLYTTANAAANIAAKREISPEALDNLGLAPA